MTRFQVRVERPPGAFRGFVRAIFASRKFLSEVGCFPWIARWHP